MPPSLQAIDADAEQMHVVERADFLDTLSRQRRDRRDHFAERFDAARFDLGIGAFAHDKSTLPVLAAIDHDEALPGTGMTHRLLRIARRVRKLHPEHFAGGSEALNFE